MSEQDIYIQEMKGRLTSYEEIEVGTGYRDRAREAIVSSLGVHALRPEDVNLPCTGPGYVGYSDETKRCPTIARSSLSVEFT